MRTIWNKSNDNIRYTVERKACFTKFLSVYTYLRRPKCSGSESIPIHLDMKAASEDSPIWNNLSDLVISPCWTFNLPAIPALVVTFFSLFLRSRDMADGAASSLLLLTMRSSRNDALPRLLIFKIEPARFPFRIEQMSWTLVPRIWWIFVEGFSVRFHVYHGTRSCTL